MKLLYSYMRRLCAYITDRLYQFKRFLQLSIDGLGLSCPVFTKVTGILPVALVCFHFVCFAQESPVNREATGIGEVKPLKIGDTIPEELWHLPLQVVNHPEGKDTITLNDYRGKKLIILDFWATWCGSCIKAMPSNEAVMKEYSEEIVILPVTIQSENQVAPFIARNEYLKTLNLTFVTDDMFLSKSFPYHSIPHYVWIENGVILSFTASDEVTKDNITKRIEGKVLKMKVKLDQDSSNPLFLAADQISEDVNIKKYSLLVNGAISGLSGGQITIRKDDEDNVTGILYGNMSLLNIFFFITKDLVGDFNRKRVVLEESITLFERDEKLLSMKQLNDEYPYTFDYNKYPVYSQDILNEFATTLGLRAHIENREIDCYAITVNEEVITSYVEKNEKGCSLTIKNKKYLYKDLSLSEITMYFNSFDMSFPMVINESNFEGNLTLRLDCSFRENQLGVKQELEKYGIYLTPAKRQMDVLVLSPKKTGVEFR